MTGNLNPAGNLYPVFSWTGKNMNSVTKPITLFLKTSLAIVISGVLLQACASTVFAVQEAEEVLPDALAEENMTLVREYESQRVQAIDKVIGSVIAIYGLDRSGGGSGVIIDPTGIALTNHHVIIGAGVRGWGGLADGELYKWDLIGTDPGGDVSIIQMHGRDDFPFTPLGDSDDVHVGDWALAMGNPFILTEDQKPTVTLGIVSGVKRYQPGAGQNQLVYGNCIQVDSSINPGNSGGPLFNLSGEVIGINGRGSFKERGRVNVGLGYAISSNQIKNFIPDLLATKLVEHATLDASFSDRGGKVVCSTIHKDSPVAMMGLELEDELLEFEGIKIENANQFTNLICTLPEDWPAHLKIRKKNGREYTIHVRMFGLPYAKPQRGGGGPERPPGDEGEEPSEEEKQQQRLQNEMIELLSAQPGTVRDEAINESYAKHVIGLWHGELRDHVDAVDLIEITDHVFQGEQQVGSQKMWLSDGRFRVELTVDDDLTTFVFDGENYFRLSGDDTEQLTRTQAKMTLPILAAEGILASSQQSSFESFGILQIDGGDKAAGGNAWRMTRTNDDKDPLFFWLRMYNDAGRPVPQLSKICADRDCDRRKGGIRFDDWAVVEGVTLWDIPKRRMYVVGLGETETTRFETQDLDVTEEIDASLFELTADDSE